MNSGGPREGEGRVVVVTGGGGGIGRALALDFARGGDHVAVVDRDRDVAEATAAAVRAIDGSAAAHVADVSSATEVAALCSSLVAQHGTVDVLCNNAAVRDSRLDAAELSPEVWERVMGVNVTGAFLFMHHLLPAMLSQGSGVIVNIASIGGIGGGRAGAAYTASKHAMIGLTKNTAFAFADRGVRCNAICPGSVDTEFSAAFASQPDPRANPRFSLSTALRPGGRIPVHEISGLAVFLASDAARAVNGHALVADAGWTAA